MFMPRQKAPQPATRRPRCPNLSRFGAAGPCELQRVGHGIVVMSFRTPNWCVCRFFAVSSVLCVCSIVGRCGTFDTVGKFQLYYDRKLKRSYETDPIEVGGRLFSVMLLPPPTHTDTPTPFLFSLPHPPHTLRRAFGGLDGAAVRYVFQEAHWAERYLWPLLQSLSPTGEKPQTKLL
jgi:hypothetical protein